MEASTLFKPLLNALSPEVRDFLNAGGWLLIVGIGGLILLVVVAALVRRLFAAARRRPPLAQLALTEDLSTYPPPPASWGPRRLTIYGLPARVRLVVLAPLGLEAGQLRPEDAEALLDQVVPGLGAFVRSDRPRVRVWPTQLSHQGFFAALRRHTLFPGGEERTLTRWVLLMGRVFFNHRPIGLGLALLADQDNTLGRITLEHPHQWAEALRMKM